MCQISLFRKIVETHGLLNKVCCKSPSSFAQSIGVCNGLQNRIIRYAFGIFLKDNNFSILVTTRCACKVQCYKGIFRYIQQSGRNTMMLC